jgi:hypothetical protein
VIAAGAAVGTWRVVRELRKGVVLARAIGAGQPGADGSMTRGAAAGFDKLVELRTVDAPRAAFDAWAKRGKPAIDHPGLVALLDAGRTQSGDAYVVTEHVPGATVAELLEKKIALPKAVIARIATDLAEAYAALEAAGAGFPGVTPDDVLVGADGRARLTGYWGGGIAAAPAPADATRDAMALAMVLMRFPDPDAARKRAAESMTTRAGVAGPDSPRALAETYGAPAAATEVASAVRAAVGDRLEEVDAEVAATEDLYADADDAEPADPGAPPFLDDNVQFTVYRPKSITPGRWYPMLAFAHLSERRDDDERDAPDPIEEVRRQAEQMLGAQIADHRAVTADARQAVPREGEITFVPEVPGVTFNPPRRSFLWEEAVHREEFRMRAPASLDGKIARGRLTVYLGRIVLAEVSIAIRVDARPAPRHAKQALEADKARAYRRIFASYSHRDADVVAEVEKYARALGDEYVRDWVHLRTGEVWSDRLRQLIADADVFQLFWSHNSMRSTFVRQEWEYALSLGRPSFVRPTYWEDPLPRSEADGLPPEELLRLHFQRIHTLVGASAGAAPAARSVVPEVARQARAEQAVRKQAEARKAEEAKKLDEQRRADEARRAEETRKADEARKLEQAKLNAQILAEAKERAAEAAKKKAAEKSAAPPPAPPAEEPAPSQPAPAPAPPAPGPARSLATAGYGGPPPGERLGMVVKLDDGPPRASAAPPPAAQPAPARPVQPEQPPRPPAPPAGRAEPPADPPAPRPAEPAPAADDARSRHDAPAPGGVASAPDSAAAPAFGAPPTKTRMTAVARDDSDDRPQLSMRNDAAPATKVAPDQEDARPERPAGMGATVAILVVLAIAAIVAVLLLTGVL